MKKRLLNYLEYMDKVLSNDILATSGFDSDGNHAIVTKKDVIITRKEYEALLDKHINQIMFFQHERLIHLIVTMVFAILAFGVFITCLFIPSIQLFILLGALMILLIPYIFHYYTLENGVQKMYRQYDELVKKLL